MCGIGGYFHTRTETRNLSEAGARLQHYLQRRGPERSHLHTFPKGFLLHTRLGIIAPDPAADQPLASADGRYFIVLNGEILNYAELRSDLQSQYTFRTQGDTEVLLAGFIQQGISFLSAVRGFFAFAIYDSETEALWLGRDHAGIKPLYYRIQGAELGFASEPGGIAALGLECAADPEALSIYAQTGFLPPNYSGWKNIIPLPAAAWICWKAGHIVAQGSYSPRTLTIGGFTDGLTQALHRNLIADTPGGIWLSGGTDSGLLAVSAAKLSERPLTAFSLTFPQRPKLDESERVKALCRQIQMPLVSCELNVSEWAALSLEWLEHSSDLIADPALPLLLYLSHCTRAHGIKWVIAGDGADEVWGGYARHRIWRLLQGLPRLSGAAWLAKQVDTYLPSGRETAGADRIRKGIRLLKVLSVPSEQRYLQLSVPGSGIAELLHPDLPPPQWPDYSRNITDWDALQAADWHWILGGNMLPKTDRASMFCGVEVRVPYLDEDWVAYARSTDSSQRQNKTLLRTHLQALLPAWRPGPKQGLDAPLSLLNTDVRFRTRWQELCLHPGAAGHWFKPGALKAALKQSEQQFTENHWQLMVLLSVLQKERR